jgi:hypothetical protein
MPVFHQSRHVISAVTAFTPVPLNVHDGTSQITWSLERGGNGTSTYDIEFTLDDLQDADVSALWLDSVSGQTASNVGNITVPIRGVRLNITAASGSSHATFRLLQSGL